jgi:hypothetical protein
MLDLFASTPYHEIEQRPERHIGVFKMDTLGITLIIGGIVLFLGGLVSLIPVARKLSALQESIEVNQERIEYYLEQMSRHVRR